MTSALVRWGIPLVATIWLMWGIGNMIFRPAKASLFSSLFLPVVAFYLTAWPLFFAGSFAVVKKDIACRFAELTLSQARNASLEGIYLKRNSVAGDGMGGMERNDLFRGLIEGRFAYVEMADGVITNGADAGKINLIRYTFRKKEDSEAYCLNRRNFGNSQSYLPEDTCISYEEASKSLARYEMQATTPALGLARKVTITDRWTGKAIAKASYVSNTPSTHYKRDLQSHCTPDKLDPLPSSYLASLQFMRPDGKVIARNELRSYMRSPFVAITPVISYDAVPIGEAGIAYWVEKGHIRKLTSSDKALLSSVLETDSRYGKYGSGRPQPLTLGGMYLVMKPIRIPTGLNGAKGVGWILEKTFLCQADQKFIRQSTELEKDVS